MPAIYNKCISGKNGGPLKCHCSPTCFHCNHIYKITTTVNTCIGCNFKFTCSHEDFYDFIYEVEGENKIFKYCKNCNMYLHGGLASSNIDHLCEIIKIANREHEFAESNNSENLEDVENFNNSNILNELYDLLNYMNNNLNNSNDSDNSDDSYCIEI